MSNHGLSEKHLDTIKKVLADYDEHIDLVGLFGSRAEGNYRENSDIDMVLYGELTETDIDHIYTLFDESLLPYRVDVKAYHLVEHTSLKAHIDAKMKPLQTI